MAILYSVVRGDQDAIQLLDRPFIEELGAAIGCNNEYESRGHPYRIAAQVLSLSAGFLVRESVNVRL
jgi:hypothetical protein